MLKVTELGNGKYQDSSKSEFTTQALLSREAQRGDWRSSRSLQRAGRVFKACTRRGLRTAKVGGAAPQEP